MALGWGFQCEDVCMYVCIHIISYYISAYLEEVGTSCYEATPNPDPHGQSYKIRLHTYLGILPSTRPHSIEAQSHQYYLLTYL